MLERSNNRDKLNIKFFESLILLYHSYCELRILYLDVRFNNLIISIEVII